MKNNQIMVTMVSHLIFYKFVSDFKYIPNLCKHLKLTLIFSETYEQIFLSSIVKPNQISKLPSDTRTVCVIHLFLSKELSQFKSLSFNTKHKSVGYKIGVVKTVIA